MYKYGYYSLPFIFFIIMMYAILTPSKPFSDPLWELIPTPVSSADMMRTPVPHGWLVAYKNREGGLVFVPDEKHEWKPSNPK